MPVAADRGLGLAAGDRTAADQRQEREQSTTKDRDRRTRCFFNFPTSLVCTGIDSTPKAVVSNATVYFALSSWIERSSTQKIHPPHRRPKPRLSSGKTLGGGKVRCTLCPHYCVVGENEEGLCRARGVRDGRMMSLTYSRPATIISDEIEKKPLFHFHPGTRALSLGSLGCNVLCAGCQNWQISHASARTETTRLPVLRPDEAVAMARKHKLAGVAFTYNDPVVWIEYVHDVCAAFKEAGLYTAFITAAYLTEAALDYVAPVVEAFKFDLKAATPEGWAWLSKVKDPAPAYAAAVRASQGARLSRGGGLQHRAGAQRQPRAS